MTDKSEKFEEVVAAIVNDPSYDDGTQQQQRKSIPNGKKVQIQLVWELTGGYKVQSITNTTVVHPGQTVDAKWVQKVCDEYDNWEVTMVNNDIAAQVFGFVRGLLPL